ncbi:MAG TPA: putative porin [Paraburkholderia sp.]|jgi:hypothetical protein
MIQKMVLRGGGQHGGGNTIRRTRISFAVLATLGMSLTALAHAQSLETQAANQTASRASRGAASGAAAPTESTVINLINLLVKRGVLTQQNANDLISQAQAETAQAKASAARAPVPVVANGATQPGDVAVPYVPEVVRNQIRDQVKQEVVAQAKAENWAQPNTFPDWVSRIKIDGDLRIRDQFDFYSPRNVTGVTDFGAINRMGGFDFTGNTPGEGAPPSINTTTNRANQFSVRARLGVTAQIAEGLSAGIQLASGNDDDPVSTTQLLGGGFDKKNIWLNKAYVKYSPTSWMSLTAGRFDNPFFSSDLLFDPDLEFDGFAANFRHALPTSEDITLFGTLGAFPVQYGDDNFISNSPVKEGSDTKWLFGGQVGAEWKINETNRLKGAIAYYDFQNSRGEQSSPCALFLGATSCSTDNDAPAFIQKGNTLIALRNIVQNPNLAPGATPEPQLFGLAYNYRLFDAKLQWDTKLMDRYKVRLDGEYVRNLSFDANKALAAAAPPVNNFNTASANVTASDYRSGGNGFMFKVTLGEPETVEKGQWNFSVAYKYLQPDAVLDAFTDSDFHLGGTNAKGYVIGAQYAVARDAWLSARYLSAREVYGPPLLIDVLQLELNARF